MRGNGKKRGDVFRLRGALRRVVVPFHLLQRNDIGAFERGDDAFEIVVLVLADGVVDVVTDNFHDRLTWLLMLES